MLRRADNADLRWRKKFLSSKGITTFYVGKKPYLMRSRTLAEFELMQVKQLEDPVGIFEISGKKYWYFHDRFWWDNDGLEAIEVKALLVSREQAERRKVERAKENLVRGETAPENLRRKAIADDVRALVWARDEGKCVACGSTSELQYDHIIPVAFGGSSDSDNLQILCGPCNRRKGAGLRNA